ncbi:MAG: hypothetical protein LBC68_12790 [Prevotellaceae bacterium]|jgi:hypothetical protein|nr:hypothetical protein [Prevotellaceae bacterium]
MEKKIILSDRTTVVGTGKVSTYPNGAEFEAHPELAKKLIKSGKAKAKK